MSVPIFQMVTVGILPSSLKKLYYRLKGAKIGKNVSLGLFSIINSKQIEIGDNSSIGPLTFINVKKFSIGKRVQIKMMVAIDTGEIIVDNDSIIMEQVTIGGMLTPRSVLNIGKRVKIFPFSFINPTDRIDIGDDVGVGGGNYIFTHSSWLSILDGYPVTFGPVKIGNKVWLPWRVFIMPNVTIGENTIIGANSTVTRSIPSNSLAFGSPAKVKYTDGSFLKKHSFEEKDQIVKNILKEFYEFRQYLGENLENTKILYEKKVSKIKNQDFNVYICLSAIDKKLRAVLNKENIVWFDLESKETIFSEKKIWKNVLEFFGRYGIRFSILDKN